MSLVLVRAKKKTNYLSREKNIRSASDQALQTNIAALEQSRGELGEIDAFLRKALNLPSERGRSLIARFLHFIIPQRFYDKLPDPLVKFVAEEYDVLELIERMMRSNINNVQEALRNLANCAVEKREMLEELRRDIEKAREENWDAQRLHKYMLEKAQLEVLPEIEQMLSAQEALLPQEEKGKRQEDLLSQLEANVVIGQELTNTLGQVCSAGISVFHRAAGQYFDYINVYGPVTVIRGAARTLTDTNNAMYASKDAVVTTFQISIKAIGVAVEAANMVSKYSLGSADMKGLMQSEQKRLAEKIKLLESARPQLQLPKLSQTEAPKTPATN